MSWFGLCGVGGCFGSGSCCFGYFVFFVVIYSVRFFLWVLLVMVVI